MTPPDAPLDDDDMTTSGAGPVGGGGGDADGTDSDGTDGDATDSTDGDASDSDGTDSDGTDGDATDTHGRRRLGLRRHRLRRHRRRRHGQDRRRRILSALDLLSGDAQTFLSKVWASRVHLHRTDPALLVGLLSLDDADHLLTSTAIRTPSIRLARDGSVLAESTYTRGATLAGKQLTGLVDPRKALAEFGDGATVVFQGLHRYWPPLTRLVAELELELGHPCQANAYLTPPGSQGFAVHSDSHDVFVFQTEGSKRWEVHTPDGVEDVLLEPGLSMYLPTGTPHAARAQDTVSLHVTLGINQLTWRGLVERSVRAVLADVPDEHLPAGYLDSPEDLADELGERLEALAEEVRRVDADRRGPGRGPPLPDQPQPPAPGRPQGRPRRRATSTTRPCCAAAPATPACSSTAATGSRCCSATARSTYPPGSGRRSRRSARGPSCGRPTWPTCSTRRAALVLCRRLTREGLLEVVG